MHSSIYTDLLVYESVEFYVINCNVQLNKLNYTTLQKFNIPKKQHSAQLLYLQICIDNIQPYLPLFTMNWYTSDKNIHQMAKI